MNTRITTVIIATAFLIVGPMSAAEDEPARKDEAKAVEKGGSNNDKKADNGIRTITGEVVDLSCYIGDNAKGKTHKRCARACAKKGLPMGLLTEDGHLYLFLEDHAKTKAYKNAIGRASETISVTGEVAVKGGIRSIMVTRMDVHED